MKINPLPTARHAIIHVSGYRIPLLGISENETLESCDLCGDWFSIFEVSYTGKQMLCAKCLSSSNAIPGPTQSNFIYGSV